MIEKPSSGAEKSGAENPGAAPAAAGAPSREAASAAPDSATPLLLWDGDCSFCRVWVDYWRELTGAQVEYATCQSAGQRLPQMTPAELAQSVTLLLPGGEVRRAAHAVFTSLAGVPGRRWLLTAYDRLPGFAAVTEAAYRLIARHRNAGYRITKFLWGIPVRRNQQALVSELFLRLLAVIYVIAFASFGVQALGLIGARGIVPVSQTLAAVRQYYGVRGYWALPTLFWLRSTDAAINLAWILGVVLGVLLFFGVWRRATALSLYLLYLSLVGAGQVFMGFQWDSLLLEAGFLAIFLGWSPLVPWLYRWLLFRLMFMSGMVKLASGDPTWRDLTALQYHYMTQPLPTPLAWYMYQLPPWFQQASTGLALGVETLVPFLIFFPRRLRIFAALALLALQALIFVTGNYTFFNLLAMALCLFLLDDACLIRRFPRRWAERIYSRPQPGRWRRAAVAALAVVIVVLSLATLNARFTPFAPELSQRALAAVAPLEIVNSYGLFAVMTTERPEIVLEGSQDGLTWREYEFRYKPGDIYRAPMWVQPYQPRLDWQMWFAALNSYRQNLWTLNLVYRLLQGSPHVLGLMGRDPFAGRPPRFIRALVYDYRFTSFQERRATGAWWRRQPRGLYLPPLALQDFQPADR